MTNDRKIKVERPNRAAAEVILAKALAGAPIAVGQNHAALAAAAADAVMASDQIVLALVTDKGAKALRLADIVNGAMLVGLVEQAKGYAFARDVGAGGTPSGLRSEDLLAAVKSIVAQNRGLNHTGAVIELGEREGFSLAQPMAGTELPIPRYALDDRGEVVRVQ